MRAVMPCWSASRLISGPATDRLEHPPGGRHGQRSPGTSRRAASALRFRALVIRTAAMVARRPRRKNSTSVMTLTTATSCLQSRIADVGQDPDADLRRVVAVSPAQLQVPLEIGLGARPCVPEAAGVDGRLATGVRGAEQGG